MRRQHLDLLKAVSTTISEAPKYVLGGWSPIPDCVLWGLVISTFKAPTITGVVNTRAALMAGLAIG